VASPQTGGPKEFRELEHSGWESVASSYADHWGSLTSQVIEPLLDAVGVVNGTRLLDVASGPGYVAAAAARRGAKVTGVDFSAVMVEYAAEQHPDIDFREGDAENLPFPNATFDAVTINFGLLHLSQPEKALSEAHRVLVPGGRVGFTVWATPQDAAGFRIMLGAIETYGKMDVGLPQGPPFFRFSEPQESKRALIEAGFRNPVVLQVAQTWRLPSPDTLFEAMFRGTVRTAALLRAQTDEALHAIRAAVRVGAAAYEREGVIELPMPAMLASAAKA
jgi:ubiquinone/menaquinone biosynthesis C-methylase UbiE